MDGSCSYYTQRWTTERWKCKLVNGFIWEGKKQILMFWNYRTHSVVNVAVADYTLKFGYKLMNLYICIEY